MIHVVLFKKLMLHENNCRVYSLRIRQYSHEESHETVKIIVPHTFLPLKHIYVHVDGASAQSIHLELRKRRKIYKAMIVVAP